MTKAALNCVTNIYSKENGAGGVGGERIISTTVSSMAGIVQQTNQIALKALTDNSEATYVRIKELFEFLMRGLQH